MGKESNTTEAEDIKIHVESDYDKFSFIEGNRRLNQSKVKKIIKVIQEDGLNILKYAPIIVDPDMNILDGQHRFEVCKNMKHPVYYVVAEKMGIRDIAIINSNTENWKPKDYLNSYCKLGMENYLKLRTYIGTYPFPIGVAAQLLSFGGVRSGGGGHIMEDFRDGNLLVKHYPEACYVGDLCKKFEEYMVNPYSRSFAGALLTIEAAGKWDIKTMMDKLESSGQFIEQKVSEKDILIELETKYNWHNSNRQTIY